MPERPGVSVVLPVHNNAATLPELCRRLRAAIPDRPLEIIGVDDASCDASLAVLREVGAVAIALPQRLGQNAALRSGLARATQPIACVMDADLQDPPEALPLLLERLAVGDVAVVFSSRETRSPAASRGFRWIIRRLFPTLPATPCLCFAIDARTRAALLSIATNDAYLVAAIGALGVATASVPIERQTRASGRSSYSRFRRTSYAAWALASAIQLRVRPQASSDRST
jgi:undecaprenyl-phosphate 4-deoxy-4-formamido-L-arabinose transferase